MKNGEINMMYRYFLYMVYTDTKGGQGMENFGVEGGDIAAQHDNSQGNRLVLRSLYQS